MIPILAAILGALTLVGLILWWTFRGSSGVTWRGASAWVAAPHARVGPGGATRRRIG